MDTTSTQTMTLSTPSVIQKKSVRQSGIELLKIFAIFIIVVSHVIQTLGSDNEYFPHSNYILDFAHSTTDPVLLALMCCQYFGQIGNVIFLFCSIWFLLDKKTSPKQKVLHMVIDVWVISVAIFIPTLIVRRGDIAWKLIIKSLFPTLFANNWYITAYILLCLLFPFLNKIIDEADRRGLFGIAGFMGGGTLF